MSRCRPYTFVSWYAHVFASVPGIWIVATFAADYMRCVASATSWFLSTHDGVVFSSEQHQTLQQLIDSATSDAREGSCITARTVDVSAADAAAESARHRLSSATVRRDAAARFRGSSKDAAAHAWAAARAAEEAGVKSAEICTAAELRVKNTAEETQECRCAAVSFVFVSNVRNEAFAMRCFRRLSLHLYFWDEHGESVPLQANSTHVQVL